MTETTLDGPRIHPAGGPAKSLVILLHGYGADGNDLIGIGRLWGRTLRETAFVAPHAPEPSRDNPAGRQWFPLAGVDSARLRESAVAVAPVLNAFIDQELASHRLSDDRLVLVGFSQGTMMALQVAPRRAKAMAGVIGYSGLVPGPEYLAAEAVNRPPILLVHGDADPVVPPTALFVGSRVLGEAGFPVEWHMRPGLPHGIDPEGIELGRAFLERVLT